MYMYYFEVAPSRIVRKGTVSFIYHYEDNLSTGSLVEISIGKLFLKAIVVGKADKPIYQTKPIHRVFETKPIPHQLIEAVLWAAKYYKNDLSNLIKILLPKNIDKKRRSISNIKIDDVRRKRTNIVFNHDQLNAINQINSLNNGSAILQGITGSGKTFVYFDVISNVLKSGRSALLLVPEISLTPQIISEAKNMFTDIFIYHSSMTEAQRFNIWHKVVSSKNPVLIIGTRSTLFLPVNNIGIIVLDECHDPSYIQDSTPKYSALRFASKLGQLHSAKVIFGSATPLVSEVYLALNSHRPIIYMQSKAIEDTNYPDLKIVDMRKFSNRSSNMVFSKDLLSAITDSLNDKKQTILYHNRRGNHGLTICESCGWQSICDNCHIPLVTYNDKYILKCRFCKKQTNIPKSCPDCFSVSIIHKVVGTQQIENDLKKIFPNATVSRFDGDNSKTDSLSTKYQELYDGKIDIAIGTQILAKGLDLPNLNLVGILQAENGLSLPDFNSRERIFQLLYQVSGRVGRNSNDSKVIVQTYNPLDKTILYGVSHDYKAFYNYEIENRKRAKFPPFVFVLKLTCKYKTEKGAIQASIKMINIIKGMNIENTEIIGPMPAFYEKIRVYYRWQIIIKSKNRKLLEHIADYVEISKWQIDLDSNSLL